MSLFWRYNLALVGGFLAMSAHVFLTASRNIWFTPQHLGNAISAGLMFGHVVALMILIARDLPLTLHNRLPRLPMLLISFIGGIGLGALAWWVHVTFTLYQTTPNWLVLLVGGFCLAIGFIAMGITRHTPTNLAGRINFFASATIITALVIYLPIYFTYQNYLTTLYDPEPAQALLYFQADNPEHIWLIGIPFALAIAIFGQLPILPKNSSIDNNQTTLL